MAYRFGLDLFRPENDPQKNDRTETGAHQRPEDRAGSRYVKKLYQERLSGLHRYIINTVVQTGGRCFPVIWRYDFFDKSSVQTVSHQQHYKRKNQ